MVDIKEDVTNLSLTDCSIFFSKKNYLGDLSMHVLQYNLHSQRKLQNYTIKKLYFWFPYSIFHAYQTDIQKLLFFYIFIFCFLSFISSYSASIMHNAKNPKWLKKKELHKTTTILMPFTYVHLVVITFIR